MKKYGWMIGWLAVWGVAARATVVVENVSVAQQAGTKRVAIQYDVSSTLAGAVDVSVLVYDGATPVTLSSLSGDVGAGVATGAGKSILWNADADWNGRVSSCLRLWIVANDGTESSPAPIAESRLVLPGTNSGSDPDFGSYAVSVSNRLWADAVEVDSNLWTEVYDWALANGYDFDNAGNAVSNNHPIVAVNWYDCVKWCNARSEKEGLAPAYKVGGSVYRTGDSVPVVDSGADGYRLPTVQQWQYMARGCLLGARFPWGDTIAHSNANYYSVASLAYDVSPTRGYHPDYAANWPGTSPGGSFAANAFGLYDMAGNVWEWCWDASGSDRCLAGGSWQDSAESARCGATLADAPGNSRFSAGFRTVRPASDATGTARLSVDTRDYLLTVSPAIGNPSPAAGSHAYAWHSTVTCSVDSLATENGSNYYLVGWTGTGAIPATGSAANTGTIVLSEPDSSIAWNWQDGAGDYDGDQLSNDWEAEYFGSFTGAVASANADGDQLSNLGEYVAGTDPTNAASFFSVSSRIETNGTAFVLEWNPVQGRTYSVQMSTNLVSGTFQTLETLDYPSGSYTNTSASAAGFYRVKVGLK